MEHKNLILDKLTNDCGFFMSYEKEVTSFRSRYQEVRLIQSPTFGLTLLLDGKIQSTQVDEFIYHEALVHPAMVSHRAPKSVFIAGGGEGATLREVLRYDTIEKAVMVDLDAEVVDICRKHMPTWNQGAFEDPRVLLIHEDARTVLETDNATYDVIICDLSEPVDDGPSYMLFTKEFYELCKQRLNPGGVMVTQSGCPSFIYSLSFHSVTATLKSVFSGAFPYLAFIPSFASNWGFTLAGEAGLLPSLPDATVQSRLSCVENDLKYIDLDTMRSIFTIPKHLREMRDDVARIIRDGEPLIVI
jgi:spermidine synthase